MKNPIQVNSTKKAIGKFAKGKKKGAKGDYTKAKSNCTKALSLTTDLKTKAEINLTLATLSFNQSEDDTISELEQMKFLFDVVDHYNGAIEAMEGDVGNKEIINIRMKLGNVLFTLEDFEGASEQFEEAMASMSKFIGMDYLDEHVYAKMMYNAGLIYYKKKD